VIYENSNKLLTDIPDNSDFYFVHSFYFKAYEDVITSITDYGNNFVSSIQKENIYAFQFHPEKSQSVGLKILENFVNLERSL
jgi:glutamine amidotransferase